MDWLDLLFGVFINDITIYPVAQTANLQVVLETFYPHHLHLITQPCAYHLQNVISNLSTFLPFPNTTLTLTSNILTDESLPNDLPELILWTSCSTELHSTYIQLLWNFEIMNQIFVSPAQNPSKSSKKRKPSLWLTESNMMSPWLPVYICCTTKLPVPCHLVICPPFYFFKNHQAYFHIWDSVPPGLPPEMPFPHLPIADSLLSFGSQFKCHLLREIFPDHLI